MKAPGMKTAVLAAIVFCLYAGNRAADRGRAEAQATESRALSEKEMRDVAKEMVRRDTRAFAQGGRKDYLADATVILYKDTDGSYTIRQLFQDRDLVTGQRRVREVMWTGVVVRPDGSYEAGKPEIIN